MAEENTVIYRRPTAYIPPYDYCDRWCDRCKIDTSKCLLWQREMDDHLHREIDGKDEPTLEEEVDRMIGDAHAAMEMIEDQAREMGVDLGEVAEEVATDPPPQPREPDPMVAEGVALAKGVAAILRAYGAEFPEETALLRRLHSIPGPKLGRATATGGDAFEEADRILQAQVAHRALGEMADALQAARKRAPERTDAILDLLTLIQSMRGEIETRWLEKPSEYLEPATDSIWWGPLRDITPTLRHFRR